MKGLLEIQRDNAADATDDRAASLRRLKQRLQRMLYDPLKPSKYVRRDINAAIDAWDAAERKRGSR